MCAFALPSCTPSLTLLFCLTLQMAVPKSEFLPRERQKNVRQLLKDYFTSLTKHLFHDYKVREILGIKEQVNM